MSQVKTQQMGRLLAAGSKDLIDEVVDALAELNALHIIEYDGTDEGINLGTPKEEAEEVGKRLLQWSTEDVVTTNKVQQPAAPISNHHLNDYQNAYGK